MSSKSKSKQEEALQFLDDLDNLSPGAVPAASSSASSFNAQSAQGGDAADVLKFIDEITQKSSEPTKTTPVTIERPSSRTGTPGLRKATERVRVGSPAPHSSASLKSESSPINRSSSPNTAAASSPAQTSAQENKGWGWGSVWSSASAALQQAKSVVDEQVKQLPTNEQAKKWTEGVKTYVNKEQLEKLGKDFKTVGFATLTDILNAVAPPISEHEVIQVWLSHDLEGYDGVESVVYRALSWVMEQVEGDLVVNKGQESKPKEKRTTGYRNFNAVDGIDAAIKLSEANIDEQIKQNPKREQSKTNVQNPTTYSSVYLRLQPFYYTIPDTDQEGAQSASQHVQFLILLRDPEHHLKHQTVTQAIPTKWLEGDLWDKHAWVENFLIDSVKAGVEIVGQDYITARMGWNDERASPQDEAQTTA